MRCLLSFLVIYWDFVSPECKICGGLIAFLTLFLGQRTFDF